MKKLFLVTVLCALYTLTASAQTEAEKFTQAVKNSPVPSVLVEGKNIFVDKDVIIPQSVQVLSDREVVQLIMQKVNNFNCKRNISPEGVYVEVNIIKMVPGKYNESFTIQGFFKDGKMDSVKMYSLMPLGHVLKQTTESKKILAMLLAV